MNHVFQRANICWAAAHVLVNAHLLFLLPGLASLDGRWWWTMLLCPLTVNALWALLHECIHDSFHGSPAVNRTFGALLSAVGYGAPYPVVAIGHLIHHRDNDPVGYFRRSAPPGLSGLAGFYLTLFFQPYGLAFLSSVLLFLPARWALRLFASNRTAQALFRPRLLRKARRAAVGPLLVLAGAAICHRHHPVALAVLVLSRCVMISFLDSMYHFQGATGDRFQGYNLRLSPLLARYFVHFNLHGVHHRHPRLPGRSLPELFAAEGHRYDGDYWSAAFRQLRLPIPRDRMPPRGHAGEP